MEAFWPKDFLFQQRPWETRQNSLYIFPLAFPSLFTLSSSSSIHLSHSLTFSFALSRRVYDASSCSDSHNSQALCPSKGIVLGGRLPRIMDATVTHVNEAYRLHLPNGPFYYSTVSPSFIHSLACFIVWLYIHTYMQTYINVS